MGHPYPAECPYPARYRRAADQQVAANVLNRASGQQQCAAHNQRLFQGLHGIISFQAVTSSHRAPPRDTWRRISRGPRSPAQVAGKCSGAGESAVCRGELGWRVAAYLWARSVEGGDPTVTRLSRLAKFEVRLATHERPRRAYRGCMGTAAKALARPLRQPLGLAPPSVPQRRGGRGRAPIWSMLSPDRKMVSEQVALAAGESATACRNAVSNSSFSSLLSSASSGSAPVLAGRPGALLQRDFAPLALVPLRRRVNGADTASQLLRSPRPL